MKKRISSLLLVLVLSVSMLAPELSMLPAAYADDGTPAAEEVTVDGAGDAAGDRISNDAGSAAAGGAASQSGETGDAAVTGATDDGTAQNGDGDVSPDGTALDEEGAEEETAAPGAYDKLSFPDLYDSGALVIPDDLKDKITVEHTKYGSGLLLTGTVADLNALRLGFSTDFDFNEGSAGRLSFDGLKDKDAGMTVEAGIYLDDSETPLSSFALKKQMGKKEWANAGERSINLGSADISGEHTVTLGFSITGKKDTATTSIALRSLQFCITTVPVMYFNIDESEGTVEAMNNSDDHSVECYGTVDLIVPDAFNADETFRDEYGTQDSIEGLQLEYIRGRGNSTWGADKKPYKVKFDKGQNLFGFGKNKHWVLLANRYDNSLIRNRMTYWLGQQLGMPYTPQCVPVEVVMNGEFYGSYLLCEQIRIGTGRVTIDDLDDIDDVPAVTDPLIQTGGYLLSLDYEDDEDRSFTTENDVQFYIESPDDNVTYYSDYIKAFTQKVEDAIMGDDFKDASGDPYTDYLDIDRAVDYWWVQEFSENGDAYGSGSTYLYKARDTETGISKLCWGPLWDFDYVAWGDLEYESQPFETLDYTSMPWFEAMKTDPEFIEKVKTRWSEEGGLKEKIEYITQEGGLLDKYIEQMETSYDYDHELWGSFESDLTEYKGEIEQLRLWIERRTAYVDEAVNELKVDPHTVKFMIDGQLVKEITVKGYLRASTFPDAPAKEGMVLTGWATEDGEFYTAGDNVREDLVLYAQYISEDEIVEAKEILFKTYDAYYPVFETLDTDTEWYYQEYRVMPDDAIDTDVTWSSSDESIATIDPRDEMVKVKAYGDVVITATLANGVSNSYNLHIMKYSDMKEYEDIELSCTSMTLKEGAYRQITATATPQPCETPELIWVSDNEDVATVDDLGIVTGVGAGTANIIVVDTWNRQVQKCKVTVKSASNVGKTVKKGGNTYKITTDKSNNRRCMLVKAKNAATVTIPAYIKYDDKKYHVSKIKAKAFAKSKAVKVIVKTKKLTKKTVKNSLKGSKVKKIYIKTGKAKVNKTYAKKYKKIFTKANAGKTAKVIAG